MIKLIDNIKDYFEKTLPKTIGSYKLESPDTVYYDGDLMVIQFEFNCDGDNSLPKNIKDTIKNDLRDIIDIKPFKEFVTPIVKRGVGSSLITIGVKLNLAYIITKEKKREYEMDNGVNSKGFRTLLGLK